MALNVESPENEATELPHQPRDQDKLDSTICSDIVDEIVSDPMTVRLSIPSTKERFEGGRHPQQYALLGHNMALFAAFTCLVCGLGTVSWSREYATGWDCTVNHQEIDLSLVVNSSVPGCNVEELQTNSSTLLDTPSMSPTVTSSEVTFDPLASSSVDSCCLDDAFDSGPRGCCNPAITGTVQLGGSLFIGIYGCLFSVVIALLENASFGYGLWQPSNSYWFVKKYSPLALFYAVFALPLLGAIPSAFAGLCVLIAAAVQQHSFRRGECGDGGRRERAKLKAQMASTCYPSITSSATCYKTTPTFHSWKDALLHPITYMEMISREDKFPLVVYVSIYIMANVILFIYVWATLTMAVVTTNHQMLDGSLDLSMQMNIDVVRFGVLSKSGAWAKAAGACLNLNCALIIMPVTKLLRARISNLTNWPSCCCSGPFSRIVPVSKWAWFHGLIAKVIFVLTWIHTAAHFANYGVASQRTLHIFNKWGWEIGLSFDQTPLNFSHQACKS
jgi:hypothetical protein